MGRKNSEEMFTGKKLEASHFCMFGCLTFSHVPYDKRTKLDPTTKRGIFVGYYYTFKDFFIYHPTNRNGVVRWQVSVEEEWSFKMSRESV